ncbi:hypothetical protein NDU88_003716 [Pleurodeles waltl]|uniref:Uncharacterized protein n=1 Tax=Pleurodeles waltl TaxID=8319 RepID=A0AAV7TQI0_PLEWA|nr:hypothetical protein NDU88_003716 [Pleurodeles waltl]
MRAPYEELQRCFSSHHKAVEVLVTGSLDAILAGARQYVPWSASRSVTPKEEEPEVEKKTPLRTKEDK